MEPGEVVRRIEEMPEESIYDGPGRLAQPDEVWNYGRGDGLEKAILLANIVHSRAPGEEIVLEVSPQVVVLNAGGQRYDFPSTKAIEKQVWNLSEYW